MTARRPATFGIYREPREVTRRAWRRERGFLASPRPRRMAVLEAASEKAALEAFARSEEARSSHVAGWHVARGRLVITLQNGTRAVHEAVYYAGRQ